MRKTVSSSKKPRTDQNAEKWLRSVYGCLDAHFGDLHWWPGDSPIEIIVGAILTQSTSWHNVEKAIEALKDRELLSVSRIIEANDKVLAEVIRPSGYYNVKAIRLKNFCHFVQENYGGSLENMVADELRHLRDCLLLVRGIGEETADSILLYAGGKPVFVIDAYARRILGRHGFETEKASYGDLQAFFMAHLPPDAALFNQYHALLVETGKQFCLKKQPQCEACPLKGHNYISD